MSYLEVVSTKGGLILLFAMHSIPSTELKILPILIPIPMHIDIW